MYTIALISFYGVENNGVRIISSVLKKNGFNPYIIFFKRWVNNDIHPPRAAEKEQLVTLIRELQCNLVGMSFTSPFAKIAAELTKEIKQALSLPVVWGGIHASACYQESLKHCDIVCRGEGEYAMLDIVQALSSGRTIQGIQNACYQKDGQVVSEPLRPLIQDLDSLPSQDYGGDNKYLIEKRTWHGDPLALAPELRIFASRGCPFNCSYCYNSILRKMYPGQVYHRLKRPDTVIAEINQALRSFRKIKKIKFEDDSFDFPVSWLQAFSEKYKTSVDLPFEILFNVCSDFDNRLQVLKNAGLRRVQVGIQTVASGEAGGLYHRTLSLEKIKQFADQSKALGLEVVYDIILDNPLQAYEDKVALLNFLLELPRPFDLFIYSLTVFPGTPLAEELLKKKMITENDIEGNSCKSFYQFRLSFSYPRSTADLFIISLISLTSKAFVPKAFIRLLLRSAFLKDHPFILRLYAEACNYLKLSWIFISMFIKKETNAWKLAEYGRPQRVLIQ